MTSKAMLQDFLEELTIAELRDLYASLSGRSDSPGRRKDEVIDAVVSAADPAQVELQAHRLEALTPFKHCFLYRLGAEGSEFGSSDLEAWAQVCWPELQGRVGGETPDEETEISPQLQILDHFSETLYVKFVHFVYSERWEQTTPTRKDLKTEYIRHPIVIGLRATDGSLTVRFPGFTQGAATPVEARSDYLSIAGEVASIIEARITVETSPMPLRNAMEALLHASSDVSDVRRVIRPAGGGRLEVDSGEEGEHTPVAKFLADFFEADSSSLTSVEHEIRLAIERSPADSILLAWHKPQIFTRITFHPGAPELYFLWKAGDKSLDSVEYVIRQLTAQSQLEGKIGLDSALNYISAVTEGRVVRATDLMQRFSLQAEDAFRVLQEATAKGMLQRRYRIRSDRRIVDYTNQWQTDLSGFPSTVKTEDGDEIPISDPRNLEVGFKRVAGS